VKLALNLAAASQQAAAVDSSCRSALCWFNAWRRIPNVHRHRRKLLTPPLQNARATFSSPASLCPFPLPYVCKMSSSLLLEQVGRNLIAFRALYNELELFQVSAMASPCPYSCRHRWTEEDAPRPSKAWSTARIKMADTGSCGLPLIAWPMTDI
jgi:hypothetical protein